VIPYALEVCGCPHYIGGRSQPASFRAQVRKSMIQPDDEMFDDLHQGVDALRTVAQTRSSSLSDKAVETLQRLEAAVPAARDRFNEWKSVIADKAVSAAKSTDRAAHEHPWYFTLGALGLGLLTGMLVSKACQSEDEEV
jgi:ElaB/YqjD/DUF883 family membrane-anchored ribosome-binding protein